MATIELTDEQRQTLREGLGKPVEVVDPATQQRYVLLGREQYERVRSLLENIPDREALGSPKGVPPGIVRSQQAFWRDLPELLRDKRNHGKTVCYHGDQRIGISTSDEPLVRACLRQGIPDDAYDLFIIGPRDIPPWETEAIEDLGPQHFENGPAEA
jgi:hypothetical protein